MQKNLSEIAYKEAKKYIPGGVNSPVRALRSVGAAPIFIKHAKDATITDIDDNSYIDYCLSWGVFLAGHANKYVIEAVSEAIKHGTSYGIPTLHETHLAKLICESVPCIEKVRFVNSGTEAVMSAIRAARAFTQRNVIVKFDGCYHGHADYLLVSAGSGVAQLNMASSQGVPESFIEHTISLPYNDIAGVSELFQRIGCTIAAVIIEPVAANMGVVVPNFEFMLKLRELTLQYGSVFIFDEVITGFRLGIGGAQEYYGIVPDMCTLGKIIGGGFPVGAYGGKSEIMSLIAPDGPVYQAGTLSANPVAMQAGLATLQLLYAESFYASLKEKSQLFYDELQTIIQNKGVVLQHVGPMFTLFFSENVPANFLEVKKCDTLRFSRFFNYLLGRGVYFSPSQFETNFLSSAHTTQQLHYTLSVISEALNAV